MRQRAMRIEKRYLCVCACVKSVGKAQSKSREGKEDLLNVGTLIFSERFVLIYEKNLNQVTNLPNTKTERLKTFLELQTCTNLRLHTH